METSIMIHLGITNDSRDNIMRTTVSIDDELFASAQKLCKPGLDKAEIIREAMKTFVRIKSAERLKLLGGKAPDMELPPRRES